MEDSRTNENVLVEEEKKKKNKKIRKIILTIVFILLNVGVIAYTAINELSKEHPKGFVFDLNIESAFFLICAVLCIVLAVFLETNKYSIMAKFLKEPIKEKDSLRVVALGRYYDSITPSGTGGQPFQIYHLHSSGYSDGLSAALPMCGFFTMQIGFVITAIICFIANGRVMNETAIKIMAYIGLVTYSIMPILIILFSKSTKTATRIVMFFVRLLGKIKLIKNVDETGNKILSKLSDYNENIKKLTSNKFNIVKLILISILYQVAISSIPYFVLLAFNSTMSYFDILTITFFIYAAITLIPTPGNSGAAEGSFYIVFSSIDYSGVFWAMLIWRFICYYSFILVGISIYSFRAIKNKIKANKEKKALLKEEEKN